MARRKADEQTRRNLLAARRRIISAANRRRGDQPPYTERTLQRAVAKVRRDGLVKAEILEAAGFRGDR